MVVNQDWLPDHREVGRMESGSRYMTMGKFFNISETQFSLGNKKTDLLLWIYTYGKHYKKLSLRDKSMGNFVFTLHFWFCF